MNKIAINQTYPAQGTIDELEPLKTLDWKRFEKLCLRLAEKEFNVTDIRDYLKQGNNQEGIDIYASLPDNEEVSTELKYLTIQCKRVKKYSPLKLAEAVNNFVSCDWFKVSSKFILATTHDLGTQKIEEEIKKQRDKLHKLDKEFEIWDYRRLNTRLKCYPQIVYDFFDGREPNWVKAFCGEIHLKSIIFSEVVTKKRYKNNTPFYIERKLYKEAKAQKEIFSSLDFKSKEYTSFKDELLTSRISANPIRILLLSVAGRGKSVEMEYLAHLACKKEYNLFPVLINLRNYTGDSITDILQIHFKGWDKIPQQELLLIFDGLDEPAEDQRQNFAGKISDFIMLSSQANIVISTRDNFITKDTNNKAVDFKLFDLYYLKDFDDRDIEEYLLKKFSNDKTKTNDFLSHVKDKSFYGELVSPFYLKYLSDVYKDTPNSFPNSIEDLFDLIITAKANTNIEKYSRSGVSFEMQLEHHNKLVSIVSISMEQLGRNFINEIELQKIIPDLKDRKLIQYSFLFNKSRKDSKSWEFEHNNFQEYLAAKTIANLDIEKIINLISVYPKKNKIKPKWLNTVAYLFSIVEKDSDKFKVLFDWIADNEPEVITRFEPDRFTKSKREDIFKKIFLKYKDSDMWIGNASTTNAEHLISFSGYSKNNISFLLNEIEDGASRGLNITVDALNMLYRFETLHGFDNKIKGLLLSVIYNKKVESFIRNWALTCINNLKLLNKSDIDALIIKCPDVEKIDTRNQLYKSLRKVGKVDEHLDFLIEGIKILEIENKKHNSIGRGYQLQKTILKLNEINSIIKIVNHVFSLDYFDREILSEYTYKKNFGSLLIERLSEKYNDAPNEIFKSLVEILYKLERRYEEKYRDDLRAFFDTTENNLKGFKALVKKEFTNGENSLNINWSFSIIADTTCVDWFIKEYKRNKISDQAIQNFRFYLSQKGREGLHDYLQSKLTSLNEAKWKYAERIDWEKLKEKQMARNFELLLNKNDFEKAVMEVFDKIGKEELEWKDLAEYRYTQPHQEDGMLDNNEGVEFIERFTKNEHRKAERVEIKNILNRTGYWDKFILSRYNHYINIKTQLPEKNLSVVKEWYDSRINTADFVNSFTLNPLGNYNYSQENKYLVNFYCKLNLQTNEHKILDMLYYDWFGINYEVEDNNNKESERYSDVIAKRVEDKKLLKETILSNLSKPNQFYFVLLSHIGLCGKLRITKAIPFIVAYIKKNTDKQSCHSAAKILIDLGATVDYLDEILEDVDFMEYWHYSVLEKIIELDEDYARKYIPNLKLMIELPLDPSEFWFQNSAADCLISLGEMIGLEFYCKRLLEKTNLDIFSMRKVIPYLIKFKIEDVLFVFEKMLKHTYFITKDIDARHDTFSRYDILELIFTFGLSSYDHLTKTVDFYTSFIQENIEKYPKVKELKSTIERIQNQFYINQHEKVTIEDVVKNNKKIFNLN